MELSQAKLCLIMLYSLIIGVGLGVVYDIFRIQRLAMEPVKRLKTIKYFIIFIEDIIFSIISALVITVMIFQANNGEIRWLAFAGAGVGFAIYYLTMGRVMMICSGYIINFIYKCVSFVTLPIKKRFSKYAAIRYTKRYMSIMLKAASKGFNEGSEKNWIKLRKEKTLKPKNKSKLKQE